MSCEKSVVVSVELFISFSETECILIYVDLKIIHDPVNFKIIIKVRLQVLKQLLIRRLMFITRCRLRTDGSFHF